MVPNIRLIFFLTTSKILYPHPSLHFPQLFLFRFFHVHFNSKVVSMCDVRIFLVEWKLANFSTMETLSEWKGKNVDVEVLWCWRALAVFLFHICNKVRMGDVGSKSYKNKDDEGKTNRTERERERERERANGNDIIGIHISGISLVNSKWNVDSPSPQICGKCLTCTSVWYTLLNETINTLRTTYQTSSDKWVFMVWDMFLFLLTNVHIHTPIRIRIRIWRT